MSGWRTGRWAARGLVVALLSLSVACGGAGQEMKMAVTERKAGEARVAVVFWEPGFGTPSESQAAVLRLKNGARCTTPPGYPSSVRSSNKKSGKDLCLKYFAIPEGGVPASIEIAGKTRAVRWASEQEAREMLDELNPHF
jgi:hypothetical protein